MQTVQSRVTSRAAVKVQAFFKKGTQGTAKPKKGTKKVVSRAPEEQDVWLPGADRPEWLDGSLPGDRGFDPFGLSRPSDFVQIGVDENNVSAAKNRKGEVEAVFTPDRDAVSSSPFVPYSEVFGLQRFREGEIIHGRWAMLAALGALVGELTTGVSWVDAGKVELDGSTYAGLPLPFDITQLIWIEVILMGIAEFYRNGELDTEKRIYPGGAFDPLGLASTDDQERNFRMKEAEIKHGRLAMVAFFGYGVQALSQGEGVLGSLAKFTANL